MTIQKAIIILLLAAFLTAVGFFFFAKKANNTAGEPAPRNDAASEVSESNISIKGFKYAPAELTVKKGATVTWTNEDGAAHTVTKTGENGPDSKLFSKGESYSFTFNEIGTFNYFCKPHPFMKGSVTVTE